MVSSVIAEQAGDVLEALPAGSVCIEGWVGQKLDLCMSHRVMVQDIETLIQPFRDRAENDFSGFRCEYWGKWFTSAALAYTYQPTKEHRAVLDKAVQDLLATQTSDGYIGTYSAEYQLGGWDLWGRKYVLLGLISYYDLTGDSAVLESACKTADYLLGQVASGKVNLTATGYPAWKGLPPSSILEPVVLLYQRTGQQKYLDLAERIVSQWGQPNKLAPEGLRLVEDALAGKAVVDIGSPKAYEQMSCYEGLCELYRSTGNTKYLNAARMAGESIRQTERMIVGSGSNHELWCDGAKYQTEVLEQPLETCVTTTWMKFCFQLLRLTGDPVWADELEKSLYNAMIASMTPDGTWWSYYCPLQGERVPSLAQHPDVGLSCCVANGPRGLLLTGRWAVMNSKQGPVVNLYAPGRSKVKLADGISVALIQQTEYPVADSVDLMVQPERSCDFTLALRIPCWSQQTSLTVNGESFECQAGTYARITRMWKSGDRVLLTLDMRGRAIAAPSGAPELAVMRGPVVLAMDSRLVEPKSVAVRLITDDKGYVSLEPVAKHPEGIWMAFEVPFEIHPIHVEKIKTKLTLCDFASAGNQWSETNLYRVWLPQPLYLNAMYFRDSWKLMYPHSSTLPTMPDVDYH